MENALMLLILIFVVYTATKLFSIIIYPFIVKLCTKEIEKNPKWITPKLRKRYYGFSDVDIITARSSIGGIPRFRIKYDKKNKNKYRLEFLIPEDTSVDAIDGIAAIILSTKLRVFYNISITNKPAYWLSILLYMLDGGDINMSDASFEEKKA